MTRKLLILGSALGLLTAVGCEWLTGLYATGALGGVAVLTELILSALGVCQS